MLLLIAGAKSTDWRLTFGVKGHSIKPSCEIDIMKWRKGGASEAYVSTTPRQTKAHPRISASDEDESGSARPEAPARKGEKAPDGLVGPRIMGSELSVTYRFSRADRIRGKTEFQEALRRGERVSWRGLSLFILRRPGANTRLGVTVSRRIGGAVARNRMKRQLREHFRLNVDRIPEGLDLVIVVHRDLSEVDHKSFRAIVGDLFRRAGIVRHLLPRHAKELVHTHN